MSWEIFLGIAALAAFSISIITPIIKLNTSITRLNVTVEMLNKNVENLDREVKANTADIADIKGQLK